MPNVPTTTPGPDDTEHTPEDVTETIPLITNVHADKQSGRGNDATEISDEEAYAKLKALSGSWASMVNLKSCRASKNIRANRSAARWAWRTSVS